MNANVVVVIVWGQNSIAYLLCEFMSKFNDLEFLSFIFSLEELGCV